MIPDDVLRSSENYDVHHFSSRTNGNGPGPAKLGDAGRGDARRSQAEPGEGREARRSPAKSRRITLDLRRVLRTPLVLPGGAPQ